MLPRKVDVKVRTPIDQPSGLKYQKGCKFERAISTLHLKYLTGLFQYLVYDRLFCIQIQMRGIDPALKKSRVYRWNGGSGFG
jgi:hypothetical protein